MDLIRTTTLKGPIFRTGTDFQNYLTPSGQINMDLLLDNFQNFIARVGFRILQVPETPKEFVGKTSSSPILTSLLA